MFDTESSEFTGIIDEIIEDVTVRGHISHEQRELLKDIILSENRHRSSVSGTIILKDVPEVQSHRNSLAFLSGSNRRKSFWLNKNSDLNVDKGDQDTLVNIIITSLQNLEIELMANYQVALSTFKY